MHIGLCCPQWPPSGAANGIVTYVSSMRDYFLRQGHGVSVISQGRLYDGEGGDFSLVAAPPQSAKAVWRNRLARKADAWRGSLPHIGRSVADQVIAARAIASLDLIEMEESFGWSRIVSHRSGLPVVTRLHGPHFLKPKERRNARERLVDLERCAAEGRAIKAAQALTAPSRALMSAVCSRYHVESGVQRSVIPNPVPLASEGDKWHPATCERGHILMVGRFDYWKGADTMVTAFGRLLADRPEARLTLVGPDLGLRTRQGSIAKFADYAKANLPPEARERIDFTGTLPPDQIRRLRQQACVTVVASRWENFPYALLEALAAGCPVITTDWPGSDEIVLQGETGLLTPVGDPEALARHLSWLIAHPEAAARLASNGLDHCRRHFSIEPIGREMLSYYEATLRASAQ